MNRHYRTRTLNGKRTIDVYKRQSVIIKGTNTGMITDIEGNFALDAKLGDIIVISYIGMKSAEVKVPANGQIRVMLKEDSQLMDCLLYTSRCV